MSEKFTALEIKDFQRHEKVFIPLDPHITTIHGPTDAGKSAILRALRWACLNQPAGKSFIRDGQKKAVVRLYVGERDDVTRSRSAAENLYLLNGSPYEAWKNEGLGAVPPEVAKLLNVGPVNFQGQLDSPFWFMDSAGQVSRELNAVVNLESIDKSLNLIGSKIRETGTALKLGGERLENYIEKRKEIKWVEKFDVDLQHIEELKTALEKKRKRATRLRDILTYLGTARDQIKKLDKIAEIGEEALTSGELFGAGLILKNRLIDILHEMGKCEAALKEKPIPDITRAEETYHRLSKLKASRFRLYGLVSQMVLHRDELKKQDTTIAEIEESIGGIKSCPMCQQALPQSASLISMQT